MASAAGAAVSVILVILLFILRGDLIGVGRLGRRLERQRRQRLGCIGVGIAKRRQVIERPEAEIIQKLVRGSEKSRPARGVAVREPRSSHALRACV